MPNVLRFKGSATERELEAMFANGLIESSSSAKNVYESSTVIQNEMPFAKFGHRFYNWKRKKDFNTEVERTGGMGPPAGKSTFYFFTFASHGLNALFFHIRRCTWSEQ